MNPLDRIDKRVLGRLASGHNICNVDTLALSAEYDSDGLIARIKRDDIFASIERLRGRGHDIEDAKGGWQLVDP